MLSQTRSIDLPSDSGFAVAMRTQQQAERAEQQRIKNLVLNYDLRDDDANDGESASHNILHPNTNRSHRLGRAVLNKPPRRNSNNSLALISSTPLHPFNSSHENVTRGVRLASPLVFRKPAAIANNENMKAPQPLPSTKLLPIHAAESVTDLSKHKALEVHSPYSQPRIDKSGNSRNNQRARKLQLSDVDWYAKRNSPAPHPLSADVASLEDYSVPSSKQRKKEHANKNIVEL